MPMPSRLPSAVRLRLAVLALAMAAAAIVAATGLGGAIDRTLDPLRFRLAGHRATGQVVIVELDAASAAAIRRWPWPRDHYARMVDRLRQAGAAQIAFDVDFSSPATSDGDAAFAAALARSGGIVALPTFAQRAGADDARGIDTLPLPILRAHATLTSVSIAPDADGVVRQAPFGTITAATARPSLSAYTAGVSGAADTFFPIDYGIDLRSVPRLSFVDVRDGRFDPAAVRGKSVIVGATAIEMGDRYAVPGRGVIPGVVIQALATETLRQGVPVAGSPLLTIVAALMAATAMLRSRTKVVRTMLALGSAPALLFLAVLCQAKWHLILPLGSALALFATAGLGALALQVLGSFDRQRHTDQATGLPNRAAFLSDRGVVAGDIAVTHIGNWESLIAVLGGRAEQGLVLRLADRVRLGAKDGMVYRIADRLLAFVPAIDDENAHAGLRAVMIQPVEVMGRFVDTNVTLGIASGTPAQALSEATLAAEDASREGVFWKRAQTDLDRLDRAVSLMGELDEALRRGQLELHYQPKLHLPSDRITSCEALVRWRHPVRGMIRPDHFIPLAEQSDRIEALTLFVIARAMDDLATWRAQGHRLSVAVNISARLITSESFNTQVDVLLRRSVVPADALVFEVTESATLSDPVAAARALARYRALGVGVSMDDYGTGQSTLSYLRDLPLTELKIDRSFVQDAHVSRNDGLLVESTIELAHAMGLKVVAEGVEDQACLDFLRRVGCDMIQGYLISKPVPAPAFVSLLDRRHAAAA